MIVAVVIAIKPEKNSGLQLVLRDAKYSLSNIRIYKHLKYFTWSAFLYYHYLFNQKENRVCCLKVKKTFVFSSLK